MAAVAHLPFYSTSYGESFGYNEREGSNANAFRNRYLNQGFRGSADLGPTRFSAQRAQSAANLHSLQRARSAADTRGPATVQFGQSQPLAQTQQLGASLARPQTASPYQRLRQSQPGPSWEAELGRSAELSRSAELGRSARLPWFDGYMREQQPRGVFQSDPQQQAQQDSFASSASAHSKPYYYAPLEPAPNQSYAPPARALGNQTYEFATDDANYAYRQTFQGQQLQTTKPRQDPGQSIPFGRLQAEDAKDVRLRMSLSSWDAERFSRAQNRGAEPEFNLTGLNRGKDKAGLYCKESISQRLPVGSRMRYALPGYMGHVKGEQFHHGATYGKTTRLCFANSKLGL